MTIHQLETDFCVVGGGLAGVCAALSAARNGIRVVLVQDRSVLGGNASSEIKMHVIGADCHGRKPGARETGLLEELRLEDSFRNPERCYSLWDLLLYEKVRENSNITLLLDSDCIGCTTKNDTIVSVRVLRNATEEEFVIGARYFADCSGDGRLGFEAGADFRMGREGRREFGEQLAQPEADNFTLGNSILFTARKHETPQPFLRPAWVRKFEQAELKLRKPAEYGYGYWWAEWGGHLNTIRDLDVIRHELLRIALGVWDYVKNSGHHPDSANWALEWVGALPGKRESRRFLGEHILVQADIENGRMFDDQIAFGGWWLDLHPPHGVDAAEEPPCEIYHNQLLYGIPLRSLCSRNVENLFFAGRNISATHVAFSSTRVMGTCAVMGQAVGTAAAVLHTKGGGIPPARCDQTLIEEIQQTLLRDDAFLPGLKNTDPNDLAQDSKATSSTEVPGRNPGRVLNGVARETRAEWGQWSKDDFNGWESWELPAWLEIDLSDKKEIREIHLTFCTGLHRELILSMSDSFASKTVRGPQPETVKDYDLSVDGLPVLSVRGNYLRKRVHRLEKPMRGRKIRLDVLAAHGIPQARVFEMRVY